MKRKLKKGFVLILCLCFCLVVLSCEKRIDPLELSTVIPAGSSVTIIGSGQKGAFIEGRTVTLTGYEIGKYEVTQGVYKSIMNDNPSCFNSENYLPAKGKNQDYHPVESLTYYAMYAFCNRLSLKKGLEPCYTLNNSTNPDDWGEIPFLWNDDNWSKIICDFSKNGYRLPTEAEFEFAQRGGNVNASEWNFNFAGSDSIDDVAWYTDNSGNETHQVGLLKPNSLGLYDMSGNVAEWCWDKFSAIKKENITNPTTEGIKNNFHVLRGGSFMEYKDHIPQDYEFTYAFKPAENCTVIDRGSCDASQPLICIGFRLARTL